MFDNHPPTALDEQGIALGIRPDPAFQVAGRSLVAVATVADGGVRVDPTRLLMEQKDLQLRLAVPAGRRVVEVAPRVGLEPTA